jgi:N-sulfoglucosamine sulfohydrolase
MFFPRSRILAALLLLMIGRQEISAAGGSGRPNILWITGEDMSARWLGCYGNENIQTPNFDRLAQEGFRYTNCYAPAPVCAPARSGLITGIHPVSTGTIYMRSLNALPESLVWYPDALRANGYFAANATKTDYNTSSRKGGGSGGGGNQGSVGHFVNTWDSYEESWWNNPKRKRGQPFFQVINVGGAHESVLHKETNTTEGVDPAAMKLAAYHPDIPELRSDYARYTAAVMGVDKAVGRILDRLEKDGLADDTIVIYNSDHGGVIGRSKRFLYDSGTQAAFIVRIPEKFKHLWPDEKPGAVIDRLVSFLDLPKTWLAITGSKIPPAMQGQVILGDQQEAPRDHVFMARERMDEAPDMQRAVRDGRYLYIRAYESYRPDGQYLEYLWRAPSMRAWEAAHFAGRSDMLTGAFFRPKPTEQLFDCASDPDNVRNLAADPGHAGRLARLREQLKREQVAGYDCGFLPEGILLHRVARQQSTIYDFIRDPHRYDQPGYMRAADVANFANPADLPRLVALLNSSDAGYRYWGVIGCIQLGEQAATTEVLGIMDRLINTEVNDEGTLDVRVTAALYLCLNNQAQAAALRSLAEVIVGAPEKAPARGRAWANVFLLGSSAGEITGLLQGAKMNPKDQAIFSVFRSRIR